MTVPPSYTLLALGRVRALVRDDDVARLAAWILSPSLTAPRDARAIDTGRGGAYRLELDDGVRVVVRPCRRGGWLGRVVTRAYVGWRPRPFAEVATAVAARARGVATPAVVGARVEGCGIYRGVVVTEEVGGARTLSAAMRESPDDTVRARLARATGRAVGTLHRAGIEHADLNVDNLLLVVGSATVQANVIDLDRARLHAGPLGAAARGRSLRRLARSWGKAMADVDVAPSVRAAFREGYAETGGRACAC